MCITTHKPTWIPFQQYKRETLLSDVKLCLNTKEKVNGICLIDTQWINETQSKDIFLVPLKGSKLPGGHRNSSRWRDERWGGKAALPERYEIVSLFIHNHQFIHLVNLLIHPLGKHFSSDRHGRYLKKNKILFLSLKKGVSIINFDNVINSFHSLSASYVPGTTLVPLHTWFHSTLWCSVELSMTWLYRDGIKALPGKGPGASRPHTSEPALELGALWWESPRVSCTGKGSPTREGRGSSSLGARREES